MGKKVSARDKVNKTVTAKKSSKGTVKQAKSAARGLPDTNRTPKKSPGVTLGRTQEDTEFSQDHLAAAAEFVRKVGDADRARALLDQVIAAGKSSPRDRGGM